MSGFTYREVNGDLFSCKNNYSMCHCVAADLRMGKGIAVKFRNKFGQLLNLQKQNVQPGGVAILQDQQRFVYYLVTKKSSWGKPTYELLHSSLIAMREHMISHQVQKLAMPRIGCGLDGLKWPKVKEIVCEVFSKDALELVVYNYVAHK
ncbi:ADP-ribose glycohydrolase OARD1 isoform X2 [Drosophila ficusphila]|uniref:ADP-ribose glycohydrolase OARD1 isoform X2 n=1 Tax=Drosophila ficusphila TaxID=30025 RepID=UPI0007E5DE5E|nr:ADP-ribose glycohydrolase OARD1 isoform X2 [Drosophila ficusphila]